MRKIAWWNVVLAVAALTCLAGIAMAQPGGPGGNFDPAAMQQRMLDRQKEMLKATDDEWKVIEPLIKAVNEKRMTGGMGMMGGMGGMRRNRGGGGNQPADANAPAGGGQRRGPRMTTPETEALQKALEAENPAAKDLQDKMKALRDARKKAEGELKQARENLRKVVTTKQEAQLLLMGLLD